MKKDTFYRCVSHDEVGGKPQVVALKTKGYSEGDIGLYKDPLQKVWFATHIPTGLQLPSHQSDNKTAKAALAEAKRRIAERPDYNQKIQDHLRSKNHAAFLKSKYDQTVTKVF